MLHETNPLPSTRTRPRHSSHAAGISSPPPSINAAWTPDGPTVRFGELLRIIRVGRSSAYALIKRDPTFPKGTPLFDSPRSPRVWWYDELVGWLREREIKASNNPTTLTEEHEHE